MDRISLTYMGIVKISEDMHAALRRTSGALSRSINAQAEHWLRVGMVAELNPTLTYGEICQLLIESSQGEGRLPGAPGLAVDRGPLLAEVA